MRPTRPRSTRPTLVLAASLLVTVAAAQTAPKFLESTLVQSLVRPATENGKAVERLIENPRTVQPGDILHEQLSVKNVHSGALRNVNAGGPVPRGTEFTGKATPGTARVKVTYSTDGGKTYSAQPLRTVTVTENGRPVQKQQPAPVNTYTHVRWTIPELAPGEVLNFFYRVKVK